MNWTRILIAGVAAAIVMWFADFVMHGLILGPTYIKYPVFAQEQANPLLFLFISVFIAVPVALLFAKTRTCWAAGVKGGATFGFLVGLIVFFINFFYPIVLEGFPYFLAWCWGGINLIDFTIAGIVVSLIYR